MRSAPLAIASALVLTACFEPKPEGSGDAALASDAASANADASPAFEDASEKHDASDARDAASEFEDACEPWDAAAVPDASELPADASSPGLDAGRPPADASSPGPDAGQPPADASLPGPDAGQPPADASSPGLDAGQPPADASSPGPDAGQPPADASSPGPDAGQPPADASSPGPDAGQPPADASALGPDAGGILVGDYGPERPLWPLPPDSPTDYTFDQDTVTDGVTGLVWQRGVAPEWLSQSGGLAYCAQLALGGYAAGEWHLPTAMELLSIVDFTRSGPALDASAFPNAPQTWTWTASRYVFSPGYGWTVSFYTGQLYPVPTSTAYVVRCVHRPASTPGHFVVGASTALDDKTSLLWQRSCSSTRYTAPDAASYCSQLTTGGVSGWRLPSIREAQSILDLTVSVPALDEAVFSGETVGWFWTATPSAVPGYSTWGLWISGGTSEFVRAPTETGYIRCVKGP